MGLVFRVYKGFVVGYTADVVRSPHVTRNPPVNKIQTLSCRFLITRRQARIEA